MKHQRRFAPKGGRIESESVAGFVGISIRNRLVSVCLSRLKKAETEGQ